MPQEHATIERRDLIAMEKTVLEAPKEMLIGRSIFPMATDVPAGAEAYGYSMMTRYGAAKIIANGADDLPMVDEDITRSFQPIYTIALGMSYTFQEIISAQMLGQSLDATRGASVGRGIAEKENDLIFNGDASVGVKGLVNTEGIQTMSADKTFEEMESPEIVETIRKAKKQITKIPGLTDARLKLILPPSQYEEFGRRYSDYDARTILEVLNASGWFKTIQSTSALAGKGDAGTDCAMILDSNPETGQFVLSQDIKRYPQEQHYPNIKVPFDERTGAIAVRRPYAILRLSGI